MHLPEIHQWNRWEHYSLLVADLRGSSPARTPYGQKCFKFHAVFTARKRSLGQGNIFTPVCHSVHGGGGAWSQGVGVPGRGVPGRGVCSGGVPASGGGGTCSQGCLLPGGAWSRGSARGGGGELLLRAVHILLECILVFWGFF